MTKELEIMRRVTVTQHLDTTRQAHLMLTLTWTNNLKLCENLLTLIAIVWILEGAVVASESVSSHVKSKYLCRSLFWAVYQLEIGVSINCVIILVLVLSVQVLEHSKT